MHILLAANDSIHSRRFAEWLRRSECQVTVLAYKRPPKFAELGNFVQFPWFRGAHVLGETLSTALNRWWAASRLRRIQQETRADLVHVHYIDEKAYQCALAGLHPLVLTAWGSDINLAIAADANSLQRRAVAEALRAADLVLVDAADIAEKCERLAGQQLHIETLTFGIPTRVFHAGYGSEAAEWRRRLEIAPEATVFLSPRALQRRYGQEEILRAFIRAYPRLGTAAVLVFKTFNLDRGEHLEEELRKMAEAAGVAASVRWIEDTPFAELPALYAAADFVVNWPTMDGFPVTFLEAAACERPVISIALPAYVGTLAERYFHLLAVRDESALAEALIEAAQSGPEARRRHVEAARREVVEHHDEEVSRKKLVALYRGLLDRK